MIYRMSRFGKVDITPPPSTKTGIADATEHIWKNWFQIWILLKIAVRMMYRMSYFGKVEFPTLHFLSWIFGLKKEIDQFPISDLNSPQNCGQDDVSYIVFQ